MSNKIPVELYAGHTMRLAIEGPYLEDPEQLKLRGIGGHAVLAAILDGTVTDRRRPRPGHMLLRGLPGRRWLPMSTPNYPREWTAVCNTEGTLWVASPQGLADLHDLSQVGGGEDEFSRSRQFRDIHANDNTMHLLDEGEPYEPVTDVGGLAGYEVTLLGDGRYADITSIRPDPVSVLIERDALVQ